MAQGDAPELEISAAIEDVRLQRREHGLTRLAELALEPARPVGLQRPKARVEFVAAALIEGFDVGGFHRGIMPIMLPAAMERKVVDDLLARADDHLEGDWLLVGGALALVWLDSPRATEDIDLFSIRGSQADRLALMDLAVAVGLPVEAVNTAAEYYVRRVAGWDRMIQVWQKGARATVYRADPTLFMLLKLRRLSEADLEDCLLLLRRTAERGLVLDRARIRDDGAALPVTEDTELAQRRALLLEAVERA